MQACPATTLHPFPRCSRTTSATYTASGAPHSAASRRELESRERAWVCAADAATVVEPSAETRRARGALANLVSVSSASLLGSITHQAESTQVRCCKRLGTLRRRSVGGWNVRKLKKHAMEGQGEQMMCLDVEAGVGRRSLGHTKGVSASRWVRRAPRYCPRGHRRCLAGPPRRPVGRWSSRSPRTESHPRSTFRRLPRA